MAGVALADCRTAGCLGWSCGRERPVEGLEFRVLGPLEVAREGEVLDLGAPRQRAVLALLLLHADEVVSTDRLIDEIWGEEPPSRVRHSVQVYVANLRKLIELGPSGSPQVLVSRSGGYSLQLGDHHLDAAQFEDLVADGRALVTDDQVEEGAASLRAGLALWRGDALADMANDEFAVRWAARLDEARVAALEDRIDAELSLGRHAVLVGELEGLVRAHPLRERIWGQLMLALYRCGRQADALRAYQRLRDMLRDELGLDPSPDLRALEARIIDQSPALDSPVAIVDLEPPTEPPAVAAGAVASTSPPRPPDGEVTGLSDSRRPPRRPRRRVPVAVVAVAALLVGAIAVVVSRSSGSPAIPAVAYAARYSTRTCPKDFKTAVPNGVCGDLTVPEDRTQPGRRWIHLLVSRAPALTAHPAADPVIAIETGGVLENMATSPAREHAELINFDDRLNKASNKAMACWEAQPELDALADGDQHDPDVIAQLQQHYRTCRARLQQRGVSIDRYTYNDAADDVIDLVRALHLRKINLVAQGDDALSAFAVVRTIPKVVRTLTLQNPVAPGHSGVTDPTGELTRAFDAFISLCKADVPCAEAYPDMAASYHAYFEELKAHPRTIEARDFYGRDRRIRLDEQRAAKVLAALLEYPPIYGLIPAGFIPTAGDAGDPINVQAASYFDFYYTQPDFPMAPQLTAWCSEDLYTISEDQRRLSKRTRPDLSGLDDGALEQSCQAWPTPKAPPTVFAPFVSAVPTLIVEGDLAYYTSPAEVASIQSNLSHASVLEFPTLGEAPLQLSTPPCLNALRRRFLADPSAHLDTHSCQRQSPKIDFVGSH
jgi:DNA-binding SARP family transcriptional activator/pimeloyl-ACP methyl ester carboxylesterase